MGLEKSAPSSTVLAPGFRFHPTDEELVSYYLKRKISGKSFLFQAISDVDVYKSDPWELPGKAGLKSRDQEWYYFCALDRKYANGGKVNRSTGKGYWKSTGRDRAVIHKSRPLGMKKTLVFHHGRAPDGKRTDWVMHEYRLVDEEMEKFRVAQMERCTYVLCRIFQKNGVGPPNGNQYAPFIEEEWVDGNLTSIPGEEAENEVILGDDASLEAKNVQQDTEDITVPFSGNKSRTQILLPPKSERLDDHQDQEVLTSVLQYKRRRQNEGSNRSNGSEYSSGTNHDHCSLETAAAMSKDLPSSLLEFSLMESLQLKSSPFLIPMLDSADTDVPSCCMNFVNSLQKELHKILIEKETLKLDMLSAEAMINILKTRLDFLSNENEDLKMRSQQDQL